MELNKLKARLKTATRGYKLLKDKTDEMVRRFSVLLKECKKLRDEVDADVSVVLSQFAVARSLTDLATINLVFSMPTVSVDLECDVSNVMSLPVPKLTFVENKGKMNTYPYSFSAITSEADYSVKLVGKLLPKLIKLAEIEKTVTMLADEIEKSKRRVNALEYIMIPDLNETIKSISMKLEENDRSSRTRLMKVKSMLANKE